MNRDLNLDGLKFIMIYLVVLGHLGYNDYGLKINTIIYSFHMPVFVFLSGYFTSLSSSKEKQNKWIKHILLLFIYAQIAHDILMVLLTGVGCYLHHNPFDWSVFGWHMIISPKLALWYLISLLCWRLSVWRIFTNCSGKILLIISCVLSMISGIIPIDHHFAFQRTFSFFPFFVLGILFKKHNLIARLRATNLLIAIAILIGGLYLSRHLPIYMPKFHYESTNDFYLRVLQSIIGLFLCISIIRLAYFKIIRRFAGFGKYTLWIYIGHTYLIVIGQKVFEYLEIELNIVMALVLAAAYCTVFIVLAKLFKQQENSDGSSMAVLERRRQM